MLTFEIIEELKGLSVPFIPDLCTMAEVTVCTREWIPTLSNSSMHNPATLTLAPLSYLPEDRTYAFLLVAEDYLRELPFWMIHHKDLYPAPYALVTLFLSSIFPIQPPVQMLHAREDKKRAVLAAYFLKGMAATFVRSIVRTTRNKGRLKCFLRGSSPVYSNRYSRASNESKTRQLVCGVDDRRLH